MNRKETEQRLNRAFTALTPDRMDSILSECGERKGETAMQVPKTTPPVRKRPTRLAYAFTAAALALFVLTGALLGTILIRNGRFAAPGKAVVSNPEQSGIQVVESPASGPAVTAEQAKAIALKHAGLTEAEVSFAEPKLDTEDGRSVYELTFLTADCRYEYEIDVETGEIVSSERETLDPPEASPEAPQQPVLTAAEAEAIALAHAGLREAEFRPTELDYDHGRPVYEVEFLAGDISGNTKYEYEIDGVTGAVLKAETEHLPVAPAGTAFPTSKPEKDDFDEPDDTPKSPAAVPDDDDDDHDDDDDADRAPEPESVIGEARAKEIALSRAGLSASQITRLTCRKEYDDGRWVYEVEFVADGYEYDCEIDAVTGKVLDFDKEPED